MNLIDSFEQFNIDVLHYISIATCAYAKKHFSLQFLSKLNLKSDGQKYFWEDFEINGDYTNPNPQAKSFILTVYHWKNNCQNYKQLDYKAGREMDNNVTADDYEYYKKLFETSVCSICNAKFTYYNPPSLEGQDNELPHTKDNCLPACVSCNIAHVNMDPKIESLHIKMRYYAIKHNLLITIIDERIYKLLRKCFTGGLATVFHREKSADETHINELTIDKQSNKVFSRENEIVATHVFALDGNSLYPSSYSLIKNENIPYIDHRINMSEKSRFYLEKLHVIKNCIVQRKD